MTAPRWRTLVADDERIARQGLRRLIETDPEVVVTRECRNGREVASALRTDPPDLLFIDVQMPFVNGLECLAAFGEGQAPVTVVVTAHPQYAIGAFEAQAADYLLKPFTDARLFATLARAKRQLALRAQDPPRSAPAKSDHTQRLAVRSDRGLRIVAVDDIDWIEADDYEAKLHIGRESVRIREPLTALERRLDPARFVRVHRSAIVNIARVVEVQSYFHGRHVLLLSSGGHLVLARSRRADFERALGQSL
jgi:two-component system, LytTR family, response regulator